MKMRPKFAAWVGAAMLWSAVAYSGQKAPAKPPLPIRIEPAAQQWLNKTIAALGGKAFLGFKTFTSAGRVYFIANGETEGLYAYVSEMEYPDRRRLTLGLDKTGTGERIVEWGTSDVGDLSISNIRTTMINNGDQGWEIGKNGGVQDQSDGQVRQWQVANRYSIPNLLRVVIHKPGALVEDGGTDFVDNVPVHVLKIYDLHGGRVRLDLNQQTSMPIHIDVRTLNRESGTWQDLGQDFSDYRPVEGVETPMHVTTLISGRRATEFFVEGAHYGRTYPASDFQAPE